jgi:hypothetical protein
MKKLSKMQQRVNRAFNPTQPRVNFGSFSSSKTVSVTRVNPIDEPSHEDGKDPALKGIEGGNCNRTACQKPRAFFLNSSTRKYYCIECAIDIGCFALRTRQDPMDIYPTFDEDMARYEAWLETQEQKTESPFEGRAVGRKGQIAWAKRERADALMRFHCNAGALA